jgi:2-methylcitrate dehydratase PrpD
MANETDLLAQYASALRYEDIPADVIERAKQCIADTIAVVIFGYDLPWSQMIVRFAQKTAAGGNSRILGPGGARVHAPAAALANGALAHAFEMDNLTWPNSGVHPGATLLAPGLAVAQERDIGGRDLIAAIVAGAEVMIRIGRATGHRNESRGFHAPGTTGPFGAAIAAGRLLGLDAEGMRNALGTAGWRADSWNLPAPAPAQWSKGSISDAPPKAACSRQASRPKDFALRQACLRASSAFCACSVEMNAIARSSPAGSAKPTRPARSRSSASRATSPRIPRCKQSSIYAPSTAMTPPK